MAFPLSGKLAPDAKASGDPFEPVFSDNFSMDQVKSWICSWTGWRRMAGGDRLYERLALRGDFDFCADLAAALFEARKEGEDIDFIAIIPCVGRPGGAVKADYWRAVNTVHEFKRNFDKWRFWDQVMDSAGAVMPDAFEAAAERAKVA